VTQADLAGLGNSPDAPALEVERITCGYGRTTILRDVSISLRRSDAKALIGANGAGKTTLLRAISGFLPLMSGSIRFFGREIGRLPPYRRAQLGLCHIQEGRGVFRTLTVRENLLMQVRRGQEKDSLDAACTAFPILGRRLSQTASTLSGGEQKMLALAAAYAGTPKLIIVDEASLGLAPLLVSEIFTFLGEISRSGVALLVVDQFINQALSLASSAYIMRKGAVVYDGQSSELLGGDLAEQYFGK
jgi:branched-chain amino acid transport system ATP-binding protein